MIKAIVYNSDTGFTQRYAELISEKTGVECMNYKTAVKTLNISDEIVYMGNVVAGRISNFVPANTRFTVKAVCACGVSPATDEYINNLKVTNMTDPRPLYFLRGGINTAKLKGLKKMMIKAVIKDTPELHDGCDFFSEESAEPVIEFIKSQN